MVSASSAPRPERREEKTMESVLDFTKKTNKDNLVFENKGRQVRITPNGQIL